MRRHPLDRLGDRLSPRRRMGGPANLRRVGVSPHVRGVRTRPGLYAVGLPAAFGAIRRLCWRGCGCRPHCRAHRASRALAPWTSSGYFFGRKKSWVTSGVSSVRARRGDQRVAVDVKVVSSGVVASVGTAHSYSAGYEEQRMAHSDTKDRLVPGPTCETPAARIPESGSSDRALARLRRGLSLRRSCDQPL